MSLLLVSPVTLDTYYRITVLWSAPGFRPLR